MVAETLGLFPCGAGISAGLELRISNIMSTSRKSPVCSSAAGQSALLEFLAFFVVRERLIKGHAVLVVKTPFYCPLPTWRELRRAPALPCVGQSTI